MAIAERLLLALLLALLCVAVGFKLGKDHEQAKQLEQAQQVDRDKEAAADASSGAATDARRDGAAATNQTETETHASQERIRIVYRDRAVPVPADCTFPDGVRREIDQGVEQANCAVRAAAGNPCRPVPHR